MKNCSCLLVQNTRAIGLSFDVNQIRTALSVAKKDRPAEEIIMRRMTAAIIAATAIALLPSRSFSQELGDAKHGQQIAETVCAECHAVEKAAFRSRNGRAPAFQTVAQTRGMTAMAIRVWLKSGPHVEMPNIMLEDPDIDDIIAYFATLK
jgi:mono/diheme cytochrome c family protein